MRWRIIAVLTILFILLPIFQIIHPLVSFMLNSLLIILLFIFIHIKHKLFYPNKTEWISNDAAVIRSGDMNLYLFNTKGGWIAIDSGYKDKHIQEKIRSLGIHPEDIRAIFLTHSDFDHTGGLPYFQNAQVYLHTSERQLLQRTKSRLGWIFHVPSIKRKIFFFDDSKDSFENFSLKPILLPGHTPGHCGYIIHDKYFCTGDSIRLQKNTIIPFFRILCMNYKESIKTANLISSMKTSLSKGSYLCTAHTGYQPITTHLQQKP